MSLLKKAALEHFDPRSALLLAKILGDDEDDESLIFWNLAGYQLSNLKAKMHEPEAIKYLAHRLQSQFDEQDEVSESGSNCEEMNVYDISRKGY